MWTVVCPSDIIEVDRIKESPECNPIQLAPQMKVKPTVSTTTEHYISPESNIYFTLSVFLFNKFETIIYSNEKRNYIVITKCQCFVLLTGAGI